jgi:putative endonuclease
MFGKEFKKEPTEKQKIGQIGEDCACDYLVKNGYKVVDRNYSKKWGEIDIVAKKGKLLHFVEVKSVSRSLSDVTHETPTMDNRKNNDSYRAEDNMHPWKLQRLGRAIQSYLLEKDILDDVDWQFDVATVYVDMSKRISRVLLMEDVIL